MSAIAQMIDSAMSYAPQRVVTVCSIFPMKQVVKRPLFNKQYVIPAGSKENPSYVTVEDCNQSVYYGETIGSRVSRFLAEQVARDIVEDLTLRVGNANAQEDAFPGIFICAGSEATRDEIEEADGKQFRYLKRAVEHARNLDRAMPSQRNRIGDLEHKAAEMLGITGESWQQEIKRGAQMECPSCFKFIDSRAKKCPICLEFTKSEYDPAFTALDRATAPPVPLAPPLKAQASK